MKNLLKYLAFILCTLGTACNNNQVPTDAATDKTEDISNLQPQTFTRITTRLNSIVTYTSNRNGPDTLIIDYKDRSTEDSLKVVQLTKEFDQANAKVNAGSISLYDYSQAYKKYSAELALIPHTLRREIITGKDLYESWREKIGAPVDLSQ